MPVIIVSNQDLAGLTIKKQLLEVGDFTEKEKEFEGNRIYEESKTRIPLVTTNRRLIEVNHIDQFFKTDLLIFASKHKSESERPSLLVHAPGNWTLDNSYGGNQRELALTSATVIKMVLNELTNKREVAGVDYDVTSEVTHHGPTNLQSPCVFIELGSNETYWQDSQGGKIVAETILKLISEWPLKQGGKCAIGFGGAHYASNFNKVQLDTDFAVSHIASKYVLDDLSKDLVSQAIKKTVEKVEYAILDWKGMIKPQRDKILAFLSNIGIDILRVRNVLANSKK